MRYFENRFNDNIEPVIDKNHWLKIIDYYINLIVKNFKPTSRNCDGGLYVGCAGIAYSFYKAHASNLLGSSLNLIKLSKEYTDASLSYIETHKNVTHDLEISFLLGAAGVYVLASLVYDALENNDISQKMSQRYHSLAPSCLPLVIMNTGSDEYFVGRAGYLNGALILDHHFKTHSSLLFEICDLMIKSGTEYSTKHKSPCPLMYAYHRTEYLGAAHGLAGILLMLLEVPDYLSSRPESARLVQKSVDWMGQIQDKCGSNVPPATDEIGEPCRTNADQLIHWCHGGPGVIYVFAKAFKVFKDEKYLKWCRDIGEVVWHKGLLKKGQGICHGIAGNGYVFLLLYKLTGEPLYLNRALQFANFLLTDEFRNDARTPDSPFSLYEGIAGTVCFLLDLLNPQQAHFPFWDFF